MTLSSLLNQTDMRNTWLRYSGLTVLSFTWEKIVHAWKKARKKTDKKSKFRLIDARVEKNDLLRSIQPLTENAAKFKPLNDAWE